MGSEAAIVTFVAAVALPRLFQFVVFKSLLYLAMRLGVEESF